jgi:predicted dinucleotide-binding enzyme
MNIGIIGAGHVGGTLGSRWARNGHHVTFSSRNPHSAEMQALVAKAGPSTQSASPSEAVSAADVVLLATPWPAARQALAGAGNLTGKILIDAVNPLAADLSGLELGTTTSAGEQVASWAPGAKVVKAFNTIGAGIMANTNFPSGRVALFYCGDDAEAKATVHGLAAELGFEPHDAGPLTQARLLEPFALLWISLALKQGYGPTIGFQLLRR